MGVHHQGERNEDTHFNRNFFFPFFTPPPPAPPLYSIIFVIIRCVSKMLLFVYRWISPKKRRCGSEASGLGGQTHGQCVSLLLFFNPYLQFSNATFRPPINYSVPIKVICGRSTFIPVLYLASFKTHYNSVITSNPLGVTICLLHAAHAYRNTLMQKKSVEYKEGRTWMQSRLRRGDRKISVPWKHAESRNGGGVVIFILLLSSIGAVSE